MWKCGFNVNSSCCSDCLRGLLAVGSPPVAFQVTWESLLLRWGWISEGSAVSPKCFLRYVTLFISAVFQKTQQHLQL